MHVKKIRKILGRRKSSKCTDPFLSVIFWAAAPRAFSCTNRNCRLCRWNGFRVIFEEIETAETNAKVNSHFVCSSQRLERLETWHMKPDTAFFILSSEQSELKTADILMCAFSPTSRSGKKNLKRMVSGFIPCWIGTYIYLPKRKNLSYKRYVLKSLFPPSIAGCALVTLASSCYKAFLLPCLSREQLW